MKKIQVVFLLGAISSLATPASAIIGGRQLLPGHVPAVVARSQPIGSLPGDTNLRLAIGLQLRNREELTNLIAQLYDPTNPRYRQYLTPAEFTRQFGPTPEQYQAVIAFARANRLNVVGTHPNRVLLDVRGKAADIQKAFNTNLRLYAHPTEARNFYAPETEPSVDPALRLLDVSGLDNFRKPHPKSLKATPLRTEPKPQAGSGPNGTYMGGDFRAVYARNSPLTGTGQILGLVEFDGYYTNDIAIYRTTAGVPNVPLQNVLVDGFDGTPSPGANSGNSEVALDIEVAMSMAPGLSKILVYESDPTGIANDVISRMATDNLAAQMSCSWSFGTGPDATTEQIFQQFAVQGQTFFNASGDDGAFAGSVPVPGADPYITIAGATTLTTTGPKGAWVSETTWNAGGGFSSSGGYDNSVSLPIWQQGVDMTANRGSTAARNVPDVSMVGDQIFIVADNGQSETVRGTSVSAPLWAGLTALMNQRAASEGHSSIGFLNPALYALGRGANHSVYFHDVTTGNNTNSSSPTGFFAVAGYDLCTGWGTPIGQNLIDALALPDGMGVLPAMGFSANGPVGGPFTTSTQTFTITNSSAASFDWAVVDDASWLDVGPSEGTLTQLSGTNVVVGLNPNASLLAAGTYTAHLTFTNLTTHFVQKRQINLSIGSSLVLNGGFESGDFSYWQLNDLFSFVDDGSNTGITPRGGNFVAALGQIGSLGTLAQSFQTLAGQPYLLSLWLIVSADINGLTTPNVLRVQWNSKNVFAASNLSDSGWTNLQFMVTGTSPSSTLQFLFRDDPAYLGLDDVSLIPVPTPAFTSIVQANGSIQLNWTSLAGLSYQLQYKASLTQANWTNLGSPIEANDTTTTATDPNANAGSGFYRLLLLP
ncbi:MAG TPA: S53 family peptidase [Candidatus Limnocylindrales bacterium]|nr:S53 family peptidase [Candidatus Limnocylindrales bacterium]